MTSSSAAGGWRGAIAVYRDRRMLKILFLGFISGFPWLLISSMLSLWLKEEGLSRSGIGLFGLLFSVYAVNALWAPLVDGVKIPFLSARFGRRRSWIILMQIVIAAAMAAVALLPAAGGYLWWLALLMFVIAAASATQDIAIDAARIEMMKESEPQKIGAGSAMATSGWWLGFGGGKVVALPYIEFLQASGVAGAWQAGYLSLTLIVGACAVGVMFLLRLPAGDSPPVAMPRSLPARAAGLYVAPVLSFVRRYTLPLALSLLAFIFLFKVGEAFLGRMSLIFYREIGFSKSEIGLLSGGLGALTVSVFAILSGFFNARYGLFNGIIVGGLAMASTNLLLSALALHPEKWLFVTAVVADQFTTAVSTVALVAFVSQLCDRAHTATQYAAFSSLGNLSRTTLAAGSGLVVDKIEFSLLSDWGALLPDFDEVSGIEILNYASPTAWMLFFILTGLMVLPSLFLLLGVRRKIAPLMAGATTKLM